VVDEANLAGTRDGAAADEAGVGNGVVGGAEGAGRDQRLVGGEEAGDGVNLGDLRGFLEGERRQDGDDPLRQHRLRGAWVADE
jgi:hypothetical protein